MKLSYKPYKRHAHDVWFGDFLIIGAYFLGSFTIGFGFAVFVNIIGWAVQKLLF